MEQQSLNLYQKIIEVKKVVKLFTKDAETSGKGAYTYTSGSQILSAIKEKMESIGLLFLPVATEHRGWTTYNYQNSYGQDKTDFVVDGKLIYEWINANKPEERQRVEFEYYGQQNDISKAFGSALTYSERYLLLKSLGVPTDDEDPDKTNEQKPKQVSKTKDKSNVEGKKKEPKETPPPPPVRSNSETLKSLIMFNPEQANIIKDIMTTQYPGKKSKELTEEECGNILSQLAADTMPEDKGETHE